MSSRRPYYRRPRPEPQDLANFARDPARIDLTHAHVDLHGVADPVAEAARRFDRRAAAAVLNDAAAPIPPDANSVLLERRQYDDAPDVLSVRPRCLGLMAFADYFPDAPEAQTFRDLVSQAIVAANPGWCGTIGPGVNAWDLIFGSPAEGNYEMGQMHLIPLIYRYYDELPPDARHHLVFQLLAEGRIHRPMLFDTFTRDGTPDDWSRAGVLEIYASRFRIPETENHILMIITARYLTNQLLYQNNKNPRYDNRRNGFALGGPACTDVLLSLLRNIIRGDFSEYNAKNYQNETRWALLNLSNYAYDHEVRLAARMVLDYVSAHVAVSSNDLRRMLPFRRRNEGKNIALVPGTGFMAVGLLETSSGADPLVQNFAMLSGNTRAYETKSGVRPWPWAIRADGEDGNSATIEALSDYRIPPSIHDLFVNDLHRRFFQTMHRTTKPEEAELSRIFDNKEIFAGSPSYLITAGGNPDFYALHPGPAMDIPIVRNVLANKNKQQLGVAVTTSFMPTGRSADDHVLTRAQDLIQFSMFSDRGNEVQNYGVAPDFACGHTIHLPGWVVNATLRQAIRRLVELGELPAGGTVSIRSLMRKFPPPVPGSVRSLLYAMREIMARNLKFNRSFLFVDRGSSRAGKADKPGFYLAIFRDSGFAVMEAFDTWLHPEKTFDEFKQGVLSRNAGLRLKHNVETLYTTQGGTGIKFIIWDYRLITQTVRYGAKVTEIGYGTANPADADGDAGRNSDRFLAGTVLSSTEEAVIEIKNRFLGTRIVLDMRDKWHPKRTSETGLVEEAGSNHEVWVDFGWTGPGEGDFFRPFNSLAAAISAAADGAVIKIMPGSSKERSVIQGSKRLKLVATLGGVRIGSQ